MIGAIGKPYDPPARNIDWATWSCVVGWPVQGILPKYSMGTDVLTCDRSHTRTVVASGAGPRGYCSPRYGVPFDSRDKGSKCVG
jgi:hypothetical protein